MKSRQNYSFWFMEEIQKPEHRTRINQAFKIKEYLLRKHPILRRPNETFKDGTFTTAKIVFNTIKSIVDAHTSYVIGNPISLTGNPDIVTDFTRVYKRGRYPRVDYELTADLIKYGNAFEYVYLDGNTIKSKVIANEDAFPVYDDCYNYTHFIEHWKDFDAGGIEHYIVYYPDRIETYCGRKLVDTSVNLTGLPIHYIGMDKTDNQFGDGLVADLLPIMDAIEYLLSFMDDAVVRLSLNPIGVAKGKRIDSKISKDIVGPVLNLEDSDCDFDWASNELDSASVKLLLDHLVQQFYAVAGIPSSMYGQSNISNVSEVSLKYLFSQTDSKARKTMQSLTDGMFKRFDYFRKLLMLATPPKTYTEDEFDSLNINFNINRPVDTNSLMQDLETQWNMGAISKRTIIEKSPYTTDVTLELNRIKEENTMDEGEHSNEEE